MGGTRNHGQGRSHSVADTRGNSLRSAGVLHTILDVARARFARDCNAPEAPMRTAPMFARLAAVTTLSLVSLVSLAAAAGAQSRAFVHVTARDSGGAPVPAAELTITKGLKNVVARGI